MTRRESRQRKLIGRAGARSAPSGTPYHLIASARLNATVASLSQAFLSETERRSSLPPIRAIWYLLQLAGSDGSPDGHLLPPVGALRAQGGERPPVSDGSCVSGAWFLIFGADFLVPRRER